jgi:adhesin transport system outer membrane protein
MRRTGGASLAVSLLAIASAAVGQDARPIAGPPAPLTASAPTIDRPAGVSPALFTAVDKATASYPAIEASRSQVRAASADVRAAKQQRLPSVGVQGVALGTGPGLGSQIVVDQPVFAFGKIGANIDRAQAQRLVREAEVDEAVQNIALDTVDAYFGIARLARREQILGSSLEDHAALVATIERRVAQEVSPQVDLELARSRMAQVEQELAFTRAQRGATTARLFQLVGDNGYDAGSVPSYDPAVHHPAPEGAQEQAIACSPRRLRLTAQTGVARAETRQAQRAILPQLSAQLAYSDVLGARAGLAVTAQTSGGLSNFAAADAARARETSTQLDVTTAERELVERVTSDLVENTTARRRVETGGTAASAAGAVTESFRRQFIAGRRTWLDVMNATREATAAELGTADAEFSAMASAARILLRTCRWQPQPRLSPFGPPPAAGVAR